MTLERRGFKVSMSEQDWVEIVAQLRHRLGAYHKGAPWMFRNITVDDAIQEAIARYLSKPRPDMDRTSTVRLLAKISRDFIIDGLRKTQYEDQTGEIPPDLLLYNSKPWLKIMVDTIVDDAPGRDQPFWRAFRSLAEGKSLTVANQQIAEHLAVTESAVVLFKERARRTLGNKLGDKTCL
jgi:hypothetical protein